MELVNLALPTKSSTLSCGRAVGTVTLDRMGGYLLSRRAEPSLFARTGRPALLGLPDITGPGLLAPASLSRLAAPDQDPFAWLVFRPVSSSIISSFFRLISSSSRMTSSC